MKDGRPAYTCNFLRLSRDTVTADKSIPPGPATIALDFEYDGSEVGKGGTTMRLDFVNLARNVIVTITSKTRKISYSRRISHALCYFHHLGPDGHDTGLIAIHFCSIGITGR